MRFTSFQEAIAIPTIFGAFSYYMGYSAYKCYMNEDEQNDNLEYYMGLSVLGAVLTGYTITCSGDYFKELSSCASGCNVS